MPHQIPQPTEHAPHQRKYIDLVAPPVLDTLRAQREDVRRLLVTVPESEGGRRYAAGKWSIREVVGHLSDAERVYDYRALVFARGDAMTVPKYDPDGYVAGANFDTRTMESLVAEFVAQRESTISFFENLPAEAWSRGGTLGGHFLSVRALAFIAAGHVRRHLDVLHERYGVAR